MVLTNFNGGKDMPDEEKKYYESEAKRKWQKENTKIISVKLLKSRDKDLIEYFEKMKAQDHEYSVAGDFKKALREKIEREHNK